MCCVFCSFLIPEMNPEPKACSHIAKPVWLYNNMRNKTLTTNSNLFLISQQYRRTENQRGASAAPPASYLGAAQCGRGLLLQLWDSRGHLIKDTRSFFPNRFPPTGLRI